MKKHYIEAPNKVMKDQMHSLPDRTNLSRLYPAAKRITTKDEAVIDTREIRRHYFMVGILVPLPFIIGKTLVEFYMSLIREDNILYLLFIIVLSIAALVGLFVFIYSRLGKKFEHYNLSFVPFAIVLLSCLCLISPLLYDISLTAHFVAISQIVFLGAVLAASVTLSRVILWSASDDKDLPSRTRSITPFILLSLCFIATVIYLVRRFT
jgi:flagellar biosynthesis protein FliQ